MFLLGFAMMTAQAGSLNASLAGVGIIAGFLPALWGVFLLLSGRRFPASLLHQTVFTFGVVMIVAGGIGLASNLSH